MFRKQGTIARLLAERIENFFKILLEFSGYVWESKNVIGVILCWAYTSIWIKIIRLPKKKPSSVCAFVRKYRKSRRSTFKTNTFYIAIIGPPSCILSKLTKVSGHGFNDPTEGWAFFFPWSDVVIGNDMRVSVPKLPKSLGVHSAMLDLIQKVVVNIKVIGVTKNVTDHHHVASKVWTVVPEIV